MNITISKEIMDPGNDQQWLLLSQIYMKNRGPRNMFNVMKRMQSTTSSPQKCYRSSLVSLTNVMPEKQEAVKGERAN